MDRITESLLTEFSHSHQIEGLAEDKRFEHFCAFITLRRHHSRTFDTRDIVVAGGGDTGIDSVSIVVNGVLIRDADELIELADRNGYIDANFIFMQADRGAAFEAAKIGNFGFGVEDFFKDEPKLARNAEIDNAAEIAKAIFDRAQLINKKPSCRLYYVTTGRWVDEPDLIARKDGCVADLMGTNLFSHVEYLCYGANEVHRFYNQTKNAVVREFTFSERTEIPNVDGVAQAYLGHIPASEFIEIISDDSGDDIIGSIFDENVRDWQDYNHVNREIRETIESGQTARFVLMNNGVTIITRGLTQLGSKFTIEDFQIVNGCQTSHVIFDQRDNIEGVSIPLRLISTQDENVIEAITRATNRQTELKPEQLYALTDFAKQLEQYFPAHPEAHRLFYERRVCQYDRFPEMEKTRIVTPQALIRAFGAMFLNEATRVTRNYRGIRELVGDRIFKEGHRLEPYYVAGFAAYRLEFLFRNQRIGSEYKAARYHILMVLRFLMDAEPLPQMNSNEMRRRCEGMSEILWDGERSEELLVESAKIVREVVGEPFDRDNIRTEPTKDALLARFGVQV